MLAATAVDTDELVALFAGDDLTHGYPTDALARAICRRIRPANVTELRLATYGIECPLDEIPTEALHALARGFSAWVTAGRI